MSAAVFGVFWLQMGLIFTSIRVNEEKFGKDVYAALNTVVKNIEDMERREFFNQNVNGFMTSYWENQQSATGDAKSFVELNFENRTAHLSSNNALTPDAILTILNNDCNCLNCLAERAEASRSLVAFYQQNLNELPLEERIKLDPLQALLQQELDNRGINIPYDYGVFSNESNSFVIVNDHYVVADFNPKEVSPGYQNIFESEYKAHLFTHDGASPGMLMVHFPTKNRYVWRSAWMNFLGSLLFTSIILFCFAYTIHVVFRQKKLSEMKNDFINNMTHEFKTPIATISLASDSINSPMISGNPDKVRRFANIIKQENIRMNNQVEKVLQMAVIEKKDFSLKLSDVNLHEVIESALVNIGLQVEKRSGTAKSVLEATNPIIQGDLLHISNIINNLLDNANKYSPDAPDITIHTRNVPGGVEVSVEDKGMGMSKEARKHIFDKFYRVHTGNLHDVKGFGLGLSYVKAMMNAHKGTIDVKSELGKGSSFILFFQHKIDNK